jgi:hypothetical protein
LIAIVLLALLFREIYMMWVFRTPAWTSRPDQIRYCGHYYSRQKGRDITSDEAYTLAGGRLRQVKLSPVLRPIAAYRPASACPRYIFAKVGGNTFVVYTFGED